MLNIKTRSLDEVLQTYQTLGKVLSHTKEAKKRSSQISAQVKSTVNKMPADGKRVAILFATATSISLRVKQQHRRINGQTSQVEEHRFVGNSR